MKLSADPLVIDLETNGKDFPDLKITQIGAVMLDRNTLKEKGRFSRYVDGRPLLEKSIRITGITPEMLEGKEKFETVGAAFGIWADAMSDRYYPMAWGTHFDIPAIRWECARAEMPYILAGKSFCIKSCALNFFWTRGIPIYRCSVSTCLKILGMEFEGHAHDGLDDALNEARILRVLLGVEPPGPRAQVKFGRFVKTEGNVPFEGLGPDDEKSPYD